MGKIFLMAIFAGMIYGGYGIYREVTKLSRGSAPPAEKLEKSPPRDAAPIEKVVPAATLSQKNERSPADPPLPVVSSSSEFIQLEAWGIVAVGGELPDGSVLRSWTESDAIVQTETGTHERRRFRRFSEAMALVVPVAAVSVVSSSAGSGFLGNSANDSNDHLK
jgi:hypothetical protein